MIKINANKNVFFTSDTHYAHRNICRGVSQWGKTLEDGTFVVDIPATRDYPDLVAMNATLVKNINDMIGEDDILIHIGDWSFGGIDKITEFRNQIKCKNIILIFGNHDTNIKKSFRHLFSHCSDMEEIKIGKDRLVACHYPLESWNDMRNGVIMLHGHVHTKGDQRFGNGKKMDVGACGNNLKPYRWTDILDFMNGREHLSHY